MKTRTKVRGICLLIILFLILSNVNFLAAFDNSEASDFENEVIEAVQDKDTFESEGWNLLASNHSVSLLPDYQKNYGVPGSSVDHVLTVNNTGLKNDTYSLNATNNSWWVTFRDAGDTTDISNISVDSANTTDFIARVNISNSASKGDYDLANITATSDSNASVSYSVEINTSASFHAPWLDDFEWGALGGSTGYNWTTTSPTYSGVNTMTSRSGDYSMFTSGEALTVDSYVVDTSNLSIVEVNCWIRKGSDSFSEDPDLTTENLELYYLNSTGNWILLETFIGGGTPGEIYNRTYFLPSDASHPFFQFRFQQTGGSGDGFDYWHIDDVYIGPPPPYEYSLTPAHQSNVTTRNSTVDYSLTISNIGQNNDTYNLTVSNNTLPTWFRDANDTVNITSISVNSNHSKDFIARVKVPGNSNISYFDIASITAESQGDTNLTQSASIKTIVPYWATWREDLDPKQHGWVNNSNGMGTEWELGDPSSFVYGPNGSYSKNNCWGTNILSNYTSGADVTLETPMVYLPSSSTAANVSFKHWFSISGDYPGNSQDDGGYLEISTDEGATWNYVIPEEGYNETLDGSSPIGSQGCYGQNSNGWRRGSVNLNSYIGETVMLRFHFWDDPSVGNWAGWYVDDVVFSVLPHVNSPPDVPTNPSPKDNATGVFTSPTLSVFVSDHDWDTMDVSFYNASDNSLIATDHNVEYDSNASVTWVDLNENTNYSWYAEADDGMNITSSDTWSFTTGIDTTPPYVVSNSPSGGSANISLNIIIQFNESMDTDSVNSSFSFTDGINTWDRTDGNIAWDQSLAQMTFDPNTDFDYNTTYTVTIDGSTAMDLNGYYLDGNQDGTGGDDHSWTFTTEPEDLTKPILTIIAPGDNSIHDTSSVSVDWTAVDNETGIDKNEYNIDGTGWVDIGLTTYYTFNSLSEGEHTVDIRITNGAEMNTTGSVTFTVDTIEPQVVITDPSDGVILDSDQVTFEWEGVDNGTGIARYDVRIDGNIWINMGLGTSYSISNLDDGYHEFEVRARDSAGNENITSIEIGVDTTAPSLSITRPYTDVINPFNLTAEWNGDDGLSGIDYYEIRLDGDNWIDVGENESYQFTSLSDGYHTLTVKVVDNVGNERTRRVDFDVDGIKPTILSNSPIGTDVAVDSLIVVTFSESMDKFTVDIDINELSGAERWYNNTLTFDPYDPLPYDTSYSVHVNGSDTAGNAMDPFHWTFTTTTYTGTISGTVLDENDEPIEGATVTLDTGESTTTDENGAFEIEVEPGDHTLTVSKGGYDGESMDVSVEPGEDKEVDDLVLEEDEGSSFPWWLIIVIAAVVVLILIIVFKKQKPEERYHPPPAQQGQQYQQPPPGEQPPQQQYEDDLPPYMAEQSEMGMGETTEDDMIQPEEGEGTDSNKDF